MTQTIPHPVRRIEVAVDVHEGLFDAQDQAENHVLVEMGPKLGRDGGRGPSPRDLLLMALAGCSGASFVKELQRRGKELRSLSIQLTGELDTKPPVVFRKIGVHYIVDGPGLDEDAMMAAAHSCHDGCAIHATLAHIAEITTSYEIVNSPANARSVA